MSTAIRAARTAANACLVAAVLATAPSALAAAQRTFVSPSGNDINPCSLTSPCRTFTGAMAQTLSGGEIIVLDSGGYGTVTITQSVSIIAPPGIYAGISTIGAGVTAIFVNGAGINVVLRGLNIVGLGGATGINMGVAATLTIDRCAISNMTSYGIYAPMTSGKLIVTNSELRGNSVGLSASGALAVTIDQSRIVQSVGDGITIDGGATIQIAATDVSFSGNNGITILASSGGVTTRAAVTNSRIGNSGVRGIRANPTQGIVYLTVSDTLTTANGHTGLSMLPVNVGSAGHLVAQRVESTNNAGSGATLTVSAGATGDVSVSDSSFAYNTGVGFGVIALTGGKAGGALSSSQAIGNVQGGVSVNVTEAGSSGELVMTTSSVTGNTTDGVHVESDGAGNTSYGSFADNQLTANAADGIHSLGVGATAVPVRNTIARNGGAGLHVDGGVILSAGNNTTQGNTGGDVSGALGTVAMH